jgi:hypothetical protein
VVRQELLAPSDCAGTDDDHPPGGASGPQPPRS